LDDRPERPKLFISYASGDLVRAAALHALLAAEGFCVWFNKVCLTPGWDWPKGDRGGLQETHSRLARNATTVTLPKYRSQYPDILFSG
jgi:hypothetical protein